LSLPHVALGLAHWQAYDWGRAEAEVTPAIRLDPRSVEARVQYARLLRNSGRYREALIETQEARRLDPASSLVLSHMSADYLLTGQWDSARAESRRAQETDSTSINTIRSTLWVYFAAGRVQ